MPQELTKVKKYIQITAVHRSNDVSKYHNSERPEVHLGKKLVGCSFMET